MKTIIAVANDSGLNISGYALSMAKAIVRDFFSMLDLPYYVSIVFVNDSRIRELNRRFLRRDRYTDVLSFSMLNENEEEEDYSNRSKNKIFLIDNYNMDNIIYKYNKNNTLSRNYPILQIGETYISVEQAIAYSEINHTSLNKEINWLLLHGLLHLITYSDDTVQKREIMIKKAGFFLDRFYRKLNNKRRGKQ